MSPFKSMCTIFILSFNIIFDNKKLINMFHVKHIMDAKNNYKKTSYKIVALSSLS